MEVRASIKARFDWNFRTWRSLQGLMLSGRRRWIPPKQKQHRHHRALHRQDLDGRFESTENSKSVKQREYKAANLRAGYGQVYGSAGHHCPDKPHRDEACRVNSSMMIHPEVRTCFLLKRVWRGGDIYKQLRSTRQPLSLSLSRLVAQTSRPTLSNPITSCLNLISRASEALPN